MSDPSGQSAVPERNEFDTDVIVIGSGFGGSVAALRLSEKGYRVWVVEKGKRWNPEDFPTSNWNIPKAFWFPWLGCYGTWAMHLLKETAILYGVGVGGGSLLYANTHLEPDETIWDDPHWRELEDWRQVMPAHFATARRMLGSVPSGRLGRGDEALRRLAERRGFGETFHETDVGIYFGEPDVEVEDPYFGGEGPRRTGCNLCGSCMVGCRIGSKNTLDRNYLYLAEKCGARIIPETTVELVEPLPGGGYRLPWRQSTARLFPKRGAFTARKVVVAAGVLGTMKLLLDSQRKGRLTHLSGELGRFTRTNSEALLGVTSYRYDDLWKGIAIQAEVHVDERTRMELVRFPKGSDVLMLLGTVLTDGGPGLPRQLKWLGNVLRHPILALRAVKPWGKAEHSQVLLVMQTNDNHTTVVQKRRFFRPLRPIITSVPTNGQPRIPSYIPVANRVALELAAELGGVAQSNLNEVILDRAFTAHIFGGCAIAGRREEGVIDSRFEVFGHPGLHVMDGSVVGANLGANPSLTITALAEYGCDRLPSAGEER